MPQDKDRIGKWLLTHHGDAILRLPGLTGFTEWKPLQPETVAPRRLPDGLIEVRFPSEPDPVLVLVEIESYADADADRQLFEDIQVVSLIRGVVPETICQPLKQKGRAVVSGRSERLSRHNRTRIAASWQVIELWKLKADDLLAMGDPGVIPWVPLTRSDAKPEDLMARCRAEIERVPDRRDRESLLVSAEIMSLLAFGRHGFNFHEGSIMSSIFDDPNFDFLQPRFVNNFIYKSLQRRFGDVPKERVGKLFTILDEKKQEVVMQKAITCPDLDSFVAALDATEG